MLAKTNRKIVAAVSVIVGALVLGHVSVSTPAQSPTRPDMKARIDGLVPELERYLQDAIAKEHVPGAALYGIGKPPASRVGWVTC
jgi:hypothetical protein